MVASVLAFHLDNGSQQAGFHCLLSKARVSCTTKSPVLIFQLPSYSAHYSYTTPSPVRSYYPLASSHLPIPQLLCVLKLYYQVASSHLPSPQLLCVLNLYYQVASSHLPAPHLLRTLRLYYKAKWLLIGLAMTISRKSLHLLSKHRTCTITPLALLRVHLERGYISTEQDDKKKPYAATFVQAQPERGWELHVNSVIQTGYYAVTNKFRRTREARAEIDFYRTIDQANAEETPPETEQQIKEQTPMSSDQ